MTVVAVGHNLLDQQYPIGPTRRAFRRPRRPPRSSRRQLGRIPGSEGSRLGRQRRVRLSRVSRNSALTSGKVPCQLRTRTRPRRERGERQQNVSRCSEFRSIQIRRGHNIPSRRQSRDMSVDGIGESISVTVLRLRCRYAKA